MANKENRDIFLSVIDSNKGIIYKIANSYCASKENRNDLVQEIVLSLWQVFEQYNDDYKYTTWIYRVALNTAISNYRKEKVREKYFSPISEPLLELEDVGNTNESEQTYSLLLQFILELKELDKALMLLYLEERSYKEIAEIIGISESNVGTKISRLKNTLKEKFLKEKYK